MKILKPLFFLTITSFFYLPGLIAQDSLSISLKIGIGYSNIGIEDEHYSGEDAQDVQPNLALVIKKPITSFFKFGIETGFLSEYNRIRYYEEDINFEILSEEMHGNFQRNSVYFLICPEIHLPKVGLYFNVGVGASYNYNNQITNTVRILELDWTPWPEISRNLTFSGPPGIGVMMKASVGYEVKLSKSIIGALDFTYFESYATGGRTGYYETFDFPTIGYRGWILGASIGILLGQ